MNTYHTPCLRNLAVGLVLALAAGIVQHASAASVVTIRQNGQGWELLRNGAPYFVKGAGGSQHLGDIAPAGGNSIRTWGVSGAILDSAARHGLSVTMGIWDPAAEAQNAVTQYRNHDALLIWALGNEMETRTGNQVALWQQLNTIAQTVKSLDPNHPVMTVIAELGGTKVQDIMANFPALDILGVNSYGGAASVATRLASAGWTEPYMITEFGPLGHWGVGKTVWGVPIEQSSTAKASTYLSAYTNSVAGRNTCLGSYAFLWGDKQEKTHTWYGMFLPQSLGGNRLGPVDAISYAWTGAYPANRCPVVGAGAIRINRAVNPGDGNNRFAPGSMIACSVEASDPENGALRVQWDLRSDHSLNPASGGSWEPNNPPIAGAVMSSSGLDAYIALPDSIGFYRVHAYVFDAAGSAATVNLPIAVDSTAPPGAVAAPGAMARSPAVSCGRRLTDFLGRAVLTAEAPGAYLRSGRKHTALRSR